jgi:MEDS: MEthanogen/methylotroph, DcmR Sensory domain
VQQSEHIVQLFDASESLAQSVAGFMTDGYEHGDTLIAIVTPKHWGLIAEYLVTQFAVDDAITGGRLIVLDAASTLEQTIRAGRPEPDAFDRLIGRLVRGLVRRDRARLRIYSETVDLLAAEGEYEAAQQLEDLWNALAEFEPFTLLCSYLAPHYADPRQRDALRLMCGSHSRLQSHPHDELASWLLRRLAEPTRSRPASIIPERSRR